MNSAQERDSAIPIAAAAAGDETAFAAVVRRMMPLMRAQMRRYGQTGLDEDDLWQECLLGLLAALRSYRPDGGAAFTTYASACIRNRLVSLARTGGIRAERELPLEEEEVVPDTEEDDPAERVVAQEEASRLHAQLRERLTPLEYDVLMARLSDLSYEEIAARLGVSKKTVDNAVQRLRRKLADS